jgi:transcriptional regulator with XRE-family HTH domain
MELIARFKYLMKLNDLTASAFADEIGVQRSSISHVLSGRSKPSLEFIQKILTRYPKVSADWLIAGVTKPAEKLITDDPKVLAVKTKSSPTLLEEKQVKKIVIFYTDNTFEEIIKQ